jgi:hypothetical protein
MAQSTTAQELFAHGPSKRTAKLAILRRPIWDSSTLLIIPPKHRSRQSIAEDPLQRCVYRSSNEGLVTSAHHGARALTQGFPWVLHRRRNFRPSSYHPRAGRAASLRNTIADRISMTVEQHLADFETPVHYNRWPVRVGDQPAPARDGGGQLAGGGATLSKSAPGEMIHLYKEAAFYQVRVSCLSPVSHAEWMWRSDMLTDGRPWALHQTINGEIKRRSIHDYEWRRRSRMGYSSPPGTGADGSQLLAITGGDLAELPYLSPQVRAWRLPLTHNERGKLAEGSWRRSLARQTTSALGRERVGRGCHTPVLTVLKRSRPCDAARAHCGEPAASLQGTPARCRQLDLPVRGGRQ